MDHLLDPAKEIFEKVQKSLVSVSLVNPYEVLVGLYRRPDKTKGGIYLTDRQKDEDIYQGKVGLVLKMGDYAFSEDNDHKWPERTPRVGDWVAFRVGDSWPLIVGEQHCRILEDRLFRLILNSPDLVY